MVRYSRTLMPSDSLVRLIISSDVNPEATLSNSGKWQHVERDHRRNYRHSRSASRL